MKVLALILFALVLSCLCVSREQKEDIPNIDLNISVDGRIYNVHFDKNSTEDVERIYFLIKELLQATENSS
jgi:hypothetical protein